MVADSGLVQQRRQLPTLGPQRSEILSQFLSQQKKPSGVSLAAGGADVASNLINAFLKKKELESGEAKSRDQQSELARILGGQTTEGAIPPGQLGPGAPVQQPATLGSIEQALLSSQFPELQQLGTQQRLGSLGREQELQGTIGKEQRAEQTQIRKEERAAKAGGGLAERKLDLENRKLDQSVRQFEIDLARGGKDPKQVFDQSQKLRKEFTALSKEFVKQRDGFSRVQASALDPSAAGDLALIFNFMKVLDPGSVVRESEFRTAADAGALTDRVAQNAYDRIITGRRLAPNQRKDFVNRSGTIFRSAEAQHDQRVAQFTGLAERANLDPQNVAIDLGLAEQEAIQEAQEPDVQGAIGEAAVFGQEQETRLQELLRKQQEGTLQ